jgi:hypothetical protein
MRLWLGVLVPPTYSSCPSRHLCTHSICAQVFFALPFTLSFHLLWIFCTHPIRTPPFSYSLLALSSHMFSHTPLTHTLSLFLHLHSLVLITRYNGMMPCDIYVRPDAMDYDYGEPTALCGETAPNSDVFVRDWTKSTVTVDCNTYTSKIAMKP